MPTVWSVAGAKQTRDVTERSRVCREIQHARSDRIRDADHHSDLIRVFGGFGVTPMTPEEPGDLFSQSDDDGCDADLLGESAFRDESTEFFDATAFTDRGVYALPNFIRASFEQHARELRPSWWGLDEMRDASRVPAVVAVQRAVGAAESVDERDVRGTAGQARRGGRVHDAGRVGQDARLQRLRGGTVHSRRRRRASQHGCRRERG